MNIPAATGRGGKHSHALQLGSIREREDPANELPEGWKPMLRTCAKFRRYTDAHNYYRPNNGELHDPAKRRSGAVITGVITGGGAARSSQARVLPVHNHPPL